MDYVKSSDRELGMVIKHSEWIEGTQIGVEMGSYKNPRKHSGYSEKRLTIQMLVGLFLFWLKFNTRN